MRKNIFVGCMPFKFSEKDIRGQFEPYGSVEAVQLFQDLENATFDSYAHVAIDTDDVQRLVIELDGKVIGNRLLRVNEVVTRDDQLKRQEDAKSEVHRRIA
jgi:RNA recognition motif-containing protein